MPPSSDPPVTRRTLLGGLAGAGLASTLAAQDPPARNGRVRQSVAHWCFSSAGERWSLERTCQVARELGVGSVELLGPTDFGTLRRHGLVCAMASNTMPGRAFMRGFNNPRFHEELLDRTRRAIDACAEAGFPNVIAFAGFKWRDPEDPASGEIGRQEGADHCVRGLRPVVEHAERRGVTVCIEHLNTRDATHPMKGHPGYQGDDLDWLAGIVRRVNSPRLKLLFDIYHVQVMHGDVIRRIDETRDLIGHVHTAGCPGRGELDDRQELQYPAIVRKLVDVGYRGYVGHEFIPTRAPLDGLRQAVRVCDV